MKVCARCRHDRSRIFDTGDSTAIPKSRGEQFGSGKAPWQSLLHKGRGSVASPFVTIWRCLLGGPMHSRSTGHNYVPDGGRSRGTVTFFRSRIRRCVSCLPEGACVRCSACPHYLEGHCLMSSCHVLAESGRKDFSLKRQTMAARDTTNLTPPRAFHCGIRPC